ncbi:MAG: lipoate--protein ligase family protein [Thermogutta sp.]
MTRWLLLIDQAHAGAWNMAMDEFLALRAEKENLPILRLYRWERPTLSLGYFQHYQAREQHAASVTCPVVRRPSGGGAILHHYEWTYSLALPAGHRLSKDRLRLYHTVHQTLVRWLESLGLSVQIVEKSPLSCGSNTQSCPFLCFQRRTVGDVIVPLRRKSDGDDREITSNSSETTLSTVKVVGSAQRRYQQVILQHGSILLARSPFAPELPGVVELLRDVRMPRTYEELLHHFVSHWIPLVARALECEFTLGTLSLNHRREFTALREKFSSNEWTYKTT